MTKPRGPRPQPTALKILRGNPGHQKLNAQEPQPERLMPDCPEHLDSVARLEWERISPELYNLGLLTRIDSQSLAAYCQSYSRWVEAEGMIAAEGITVTNAKSGSVRIHPAVQIAKESMRLVREFMSEFGLSPATRCRLKVDPSKKKSVPTRARA